LQSTRHIARRIKDYSPTSGVYVFAGVFLLRIFVLFRLTASPFLLPGRGDMHFYNDWALRILHGQWTDHLAFYGLPLYAYLLAGIYKICGYTPFVPGVLQAGLDAGTAVLVFKISDSLLASLERPRATAFSVLRETRIFAIIAAAGWAAFLPAQAYSAILMPTAWAVFIFWLLVWRVVRSDNSPGPREQFVTGLVIGIAAMGVATVLFLIPLLLWTALTRFGGPARSRIRRFALGAVCLFAGLTLGTSPCWIHNYFIAGDPVALSAHSGINFWIGNNPDANGYPRFPPGLHAGQAALLQDSIDGAEIALGRPLKHGEVSAFWAAKARHYIASHPLEWLKLLGVKLRNLWSAFQYDDLSIITALSAAHVLLPGISFGVVAALGIPGMILFWRRVPRSRLVTAAICLQIAALIPVFVTERYRMPIVPGLLILGSLFVFAVWQSLVTGNIKFLALGTGLLILSTTAVSWPQRDPSLWALDAYNSGWQALETGDLERAEKTLRLAYSYVPTNPETNFAFGNLRLEQGRPAAAGEMYQRTLSLDPKHVGALNNLGVIALENKRAPEAIDWFRRALVLNSRNGKTHFLLAKALLLDGDASDARAEIDQAIALNPQQPEFRQLKSSLP
jgi:Tetratricopeptide repeat